MKGRAPDFVPGVIILFRISNYSFLTNMFITILMSLQVIMTFTNCLHGGIFCLYTQMIFSTCSAQVLKLF